MTKKNRCRPAFILIIFSTITIIILASLSLGRSLFAAADAFYEIETNGTNTGGIVGNDASASGGQFLQFTDAGDNWELSTNMSSVGIWVIRSLYGTIFDVYVNGTYYGSFNTYDQVGTSYQRELRLFNFLDGSNHTITINHTGAINPSGQKNLDLDAFIINSTAVIDLREAEDDWINRSGTYVTETGNASSDALLQLPDSSSYFQAWGSGKYLLIYTKDSLFGTFFNVTYNGQNFSFDTYYNGYLYQQKKTVFINSTQNNYLLTINNSGINNPVGNSLIDLDYIIFYPFDRPTNSTINTTATARLNDTHLNISWSASSAESGRTITYFVIATAYENTTSITLTNTTDLNLTADLSGHPQDFYTFEIEADDDYLESFSADTTELLFFDSKSVNQRAADAANYIVTSQKGDGAIPDYYDNDFYNSDNTAGYSGIALYLAWKNLSNNTFIDSLGSYLDWFADLQEADGTWHYAYKYNDTNQSYYAEVWDYYKGLNITDIKVVDAIQAYFSYDLWMYSVSGRNSTKVANLTPVAEKGMQRLIIDNHDGNRFFYSSTQYKNDTNAWSLLETKYAAGQVDIFLGLVALWNLTQNLSYLQYAQDIKNNFDSYYWNTSSARYAISLDSNDAQESSTEYIFAQGYAPAVFGSSQNNSLNAYNYLKTKELIDGSINASSSPGETLASAMTILASRKLDQGATGNLSNYLRKMQVDSSTNASGGMKFNKSLSSLSMTTVDFASPALFSDNLPLPDLKFKNAVNTSANFRRYQNFTANITIEYSSLDSYIFSTNASGLWTNKTISIKSISGVQYNASEQANLTLARGKTICWYYWANDTSASSWQSDTYCFSVENTAPVFNGTLSNYSLTAGEELTFQANCSDADDEAITYYDNTSLFDIDSSSGTVSDTSVSGETGTYVINVTCGDGTTNTSQIFSYTIDAADSGSPGGGNGGGGGGGGGGGSSKPKPIKECTERKDCPKNQYCIDYRCVKIFDIQTLQADSPLEPGEFLDFTYLIKGMANISGDVSLQYRLEYSGTESISTAATISGSDVLFVGDFEEKIESASLFVPSDLKEGKYLLNIKLSYDGYEVTSSRTIEIKFDVPLLIRATPVGLGNIPPGLPWNYSLILSSNKDHLILASLKQKITKDEKTLWIRQNDHLINRSAMVQNNVPGLSPGDYLLELSISAGNYSSTAIESFTVYGEIEKETIPWYAFKETSKKVIKNMIERLIKWGGETSDWIYNLIYDLISGFFKTDKLEKKELGKEARLQVLIIIIYLIAGLAGAIYYFHKKKRK